MLPEAGVVERCRGRLQLLALALIVASFRPEAGQLPFSMFDFLPVGAIVLLLGVLLIALLGGWLVPERITAESKE